ncbi:penicillin-binding protein 1A [Marivirga tractuosa]|uniref:Peptidoglycan glycosyltransferase n=1 Tax=Marivirga tractuosa (strain ATCC 23168 / DSM 4126 / NBRC 15989 / NCIMB 1408 / VKM B-1430 / H-43) TaxID=643867 RepID=E4TL64_MARTH|nr:transglycosylase domain-containing protein [Marivirga tractuosa]ADR20202.1 Peptidoglycan glycosyltransferase [Marivirga tractuosa DSM 4126]BDD15357.1 penicillin-binding protein 1A [Marivirga tractuosa]
MPKKKKKKTLKHRIIKFLSICTGAGLLFILLFFYSIKAGLFGSLPDDKVLNNIKNAQATEILDENDENIGFLYRSYRSNVGYNELPQHLIDALVATEDVRFFEHSGIDYRSLVRVIVKTVILQDRSAGGGSTLSQQLAKNLFPREYSHRIEIIVIKIKEAIIAKRLEEIYSKEELLTLYLNTVSFPDNTFGIEAASQTFFNKPVKALSLEESAILVGSLKATYTYNPRIFPENSFERRNVVLSQMEKYDKLSEEEYQKAVAKEIKLDYRPVKADQGIAPYFREQVRKELVKWADDYKKANGESVDIYGDGLKIHTTLNARMQRYAESAMKKHMQDLQKAFENNWGNLAPWKKKEVYEQYIKRSYHYKALKNQGKPDAEIVKILNEKKEMQVFDWSGSDVQTMSVIDSIQHSLKTLQSGFVAMDPKSGAIKTWIGGIDFEYFKYDHVKQSKRQVGSTFKPLVYMTALNNGVEPCDYFPARAVSYENLEGWKPTNSDDEDYTHINVSMQEALRKSMNTVSVKILEETGIPSVINLAKAVGIKSDLPEVASLALGTAELSMLELATAYSSFLNEGKASDPFFIEKITDASGKVLAEFKPENEYEKAFSDLNQEMILSMMQEVVNSGTASRLRWRYNLKNDIAGKTGTTQNNRDGWFVGLLPNLVTISWTGSDNGSIGFRSTSIGQGANSALPIFGLWMQQVNADQSLNQYSKSQFSPLSDKAERLMDCPPIKEDGFFKKLFTNPDKEKSKDFDKDGKEKKGLFKRIKKLFNKDG